MSGHNKYHLQIALRYAEIMNFNVLPLDGKVPKINWKPWQHKIQTKKDIQLMDWNDCSGIGVVMGIKNLRCFDLDKVEDPCIVGQILTELSLPQDYTWVVQSGSGEGFHVYFLCLEPEDKQRQIQSNQILLGEKAVHKYYLKQDGICHHLEVRWKDCQTALPPSMHKSGGIYNFINNEPLELPATVEFEKITAFLKKYCKIKEGPEDQKNEVKSYSFDKEMLEGALDFLSNNLPAGSYDEWVTIGFGLASLGQTGEEYFVKLSLSNPNYKDSETDLRTKYKELLTNHNGSTNIRSIYRIAENYGWKKPAIHFWYLDEKRNVKISRTGFKRFLESEGYCKLKKDGGYLFVRILNNIVNEFDAIQVKDFVLHYLYTLAAEEFEDINRTEIIDALIRGANVFFADQFFEFLITRNIEFKRDTAKEGNLFYKNGYVAVTADSVQLKDYKAMDGYIWERQIINRHYHPTERRSDYEEFIHNVCRKNVQRTKALKSGIGYSIHTYKDPNNSKAVVFIDEKKSEGAYGRSGKGLVIKGISKLRTVVVEDGRNFNISKNFAFQRVSVDTNMLAIEDIHEKFPFDKLFSIITEGLTIEKKHRDEIFIPFPESPKIIISSNFTIKGVDDSTKDRQFIVEFSDHYNKRNRPVYEFGKNFFEGWDDEEWRAFDSLMIDCLQMYLKEGLISYEYVNLEQKQLIDETCDEFAEFSTDLKPNCEYNKKEMFDQFKGEYLDFEKLTQGKFTRWLKLWARIKEYEVIESKSDSIRSILFSKIKKVG